MHACMHACFWWVLLVSMHACMHAFSVHFYHFYLYLHVYLYPSISLSIDIYIYMYMPICISIYLYIYIYKYPYIYIYICLHLYIYVYIYLYTFMYIYTYTYVYIYIYMHIHICIYICLLCVSFACVSSVQLASTYQSPATTIFVRKPIDKSPRWPSFCCWKETAAQLEAFFDCLEIPLEEILRIPISPRKSLLQLSMKERTLRIQPHIIR